MALSQEEFCHVRRDHDDTRRRLRRLESFVEMVVMAIMEMVGMEIVEMEMVEMVGMEMVEMEMVGIEMVEMEIHMRMVE
ncbi:hypothetical protein Tco_0574862, partial [Tanacetum coccineum]